MQSISVFTPTGVFDVQDNFIKNISESIVATINGIEESLNFELFVNETIGNFTRCRVRIDEIMSLRARVLNTDVTEVIVNNAYEVFIDGVDGNLIVLANKKSAESIHEFVSHSFNLLLERKKFDLMTIIDDSSNVKRTQFRNLLIETINGSSLSGNRVTDTEMYELMLNAGDLSTIAVVYPFNNTEIKFSVSDSGSIVLFSTIATEVMLDWINNLLM